MVATMTWLTVMEYLCHKLLRICSTCRKYFSVLSSFMAYHQACNQINTTGVTSGAGTSYPSGEPEFTPSFLQGSCYSIFYMYVLQIVVCSFVLFLLAILLSVLHRFTDFRIFKLFFIYSVLLITHILNLINFNITNMKIDYLINCLFPLCLLD